MKGPRPPVVTGHTPRFRAPASGALQGLRAARPGKESNDSVESRTVVPVAL